MCVAAGFARPLGRRFGRSGTAGAAVTKRHPARRFATVFCEPDISRAEPHKLRYAARRRGTLDEACTVTSLSESPPTKDTFSRGNEHKSWSRPISPVRFLSFAFNSRFPPRPRAERLYHCVSCVLKIQPNAIERYQRGEIRATLRTSR